MKYDTKVLLENSLWLVFIVGLCVLSLVLVDATLKNKEEVIAAIPSPTLPPIKANIINSTGGCGHINRIVLQKDETALVYWQWVCSDVNRGYVRLSIIGQNIYGAVLDSRFTYLVAGVPIKKNTKFETVINHFMDDSRIIEMNFFSE